jgi:hypothetical protein
MPVPPIDERLRVGAGGGGRHVLAVQLANRALQRTALARRRFHEEAAPVKK